MDTEFYYIFDSKERMFRPAGLLRPTLPSLSRDTSRVALRPRASVVELQADFRDMQIKQIQGDALNSLLDWYNFSVFWWWIIKYTHLA